MRDRKISDSAELYELVLECPDIAGKVLPGQIVHVACGEGTTLRRPISVCEAIDSEKIRLCYGVRGKGTKWMSERKTGERISLLGPLGHGSSSS